MIYSESEIYTKIKNSKDKTSMIRIQAELNGVSKNTIQEIYDKYLVLEKEKELMSKDESTTTKKSRVVYSDEFKESVIECIRKGMSEKESKKELGVNDSGSGFTQLYYKLKKKYKEYVDVPVMKANNAGDIHQVKEDSGILHEGFKTKMTVLPVKKVETPKMQDIVEKVLKNSEVDTIKDEQKSDDTVKINQETITKEDVNVIGEKIRKSKDVQHKIIEPTSPVDEDKKQTMSDSASNTIKENPPKESAETVQLEVVDVTSKENNDSIKDIEESLNSCEDTKKDEDSKKKKNVKPTEKDKRCKSSVDTSELKELLTLMKAKKSSLKSVINVKETELELLRNTLNSYRAIIDDIEDVLDDCEDL